MLNQVSAGYKNQTKHTLPNRVGVLLTVHPRVVWEPDQSPRATRKDPERRSSIVTHILLGHQTHAMTSRVLRQTVNCSLVRNSNVDL